MRSVRPLSSADLEALTTKRLLAYRSLLLSLADSASLSDLDESELVTLDTSVLYFKDQPAWRELYADVKQVLATREHVG
jgi:hypothetical protein